MREHTHSHLIIHETLCSDPDLSVNNYLKQFLSLSFDIVRDPLFAIVNAFDAVCEYGASTRCVTFPLPSKHSLRNKRLDQEVARIERELQAFEQSVTEYGCSLQSDAKDSVAHRHMVNFIKRTPIGSKFLKAVDISGFPYGRVADTGCCRI